MARALESLVVKMTIGAAADDRRVRDGDRLEGLSHLKCGHDPRYIRDQGLRQEANLGAGVGDDLLSLAIIELLGHLQRLCRGPTEARRAELLQRG